MKGVDSMAMPEGSTLYELIQTGITHTHASVRVLVRLRKELSLGEEYPQMYLLQLIKVVWANVSQNWYNIDAELEVEAKKAVPRDDQHILNRNSSSIHGSPGPSRTKKIFVGGLASTLTETEFKRTATKVSEMLGNVNTSSALSAFEKMEEKGRAFRY
ncbi:hypothetical protein Syun_009668 [Stephania yunnanensis]|uniref:Uncharacterized protein n=1 Tax=Stephania yunnanensis TaxID=152371 RepID=A0AAP0PQW0_9MAGN